MAHALVLIDLQEALCRPDGTIGAPSGIGPEAHRRDVLGAAARGLEAARAAGVMVAHVMVGLDEHATLKMTRTPGSDGVAQVLVLGREETEICHEVAPLPTEPVIVKGGVDPFLGTPLDALLRNRGVSTLYLAGVTTNHAVESAARHASDLGYDVFVIDEMCASMSQEMHDFSLKTVLPVFGEALSEQQYLDRIRVGPTAS
jgi:nicotinamidase-related amidase